MPQNEAYGNHNLWMKRAKERLILATAEFNSDLAFAKGVREAPIATD
jgi:hypothetical protein